jgi:NAD(P)-dependent dehydrogenase (short-subunit alcohol dehydrogenase family)
MSHAVVVGAGGGIGAALVARLAADPRYSAVHALSRRPVALASPTVRPGLIDVCDPASIERAAAAIDGAVTCLLVATGLLHDGDGGPERRLAELDADRLARSFRVNAIGPALVLRHFARLVPRDRPAALACLSARVGSISDNRSGGWYGYRASKAALNQIVRTAAIELARTHPQLRCVALHPGTVDTGLSRPFQARVPADRLFTPDHAADRLLAVLDGLSPAESGRCFAWDGTQIAP